MSDAPEHEANDAASALAALPAISLWLVDGFNVLHAHLLQGRDRKDWWSAERRQLVIEQAERLAARGERVEVVFDGSGPPASRVARRRAAARRFRQGRGRLDAEDDARRRGPRRRGHCHGRSAGEGPCAQVGRTCGVAARVVGEMCGNAVGFRDRR
jgi:hypothetical protein